MIQPYGSVSLHCMRSGRVGKLSSDPVSSVVIEDMMMQQLVARSYGFNSNAQLPFKQQSRDP
jgi:hypothetical protein